VVGTEHPEQLVNVAFSVTASATYDRKITRRMPKARKVLITREPPVRAVPKGIEVIEAWRYLLTGERSIVHPSAGSHADTSK
jgi:hypothetical protein